MPRSHCANRAGTSFGMFGMLILICQCTCVSAAGLRDPEVDAYNVRIGTQTFAPRYQFTAETKLVETAEAIRAMGSDVIKLYMGHNTSGQYGIPRPGAVTSLRALAEQEPSYKRVFDMPFRHYLAWIYCLGASSDTWWKDGFSSNEAAAEYNEVYALARYLLTNYSNSGKSFYLGHWEGDWHLLNGYDTSGNPSPTAIQGMVAWLNTRQKAVDDAVQQTAHTNVFVYHYAEANRVRDAMVNGAANNQRLVNSVLPLVTNIDLVSWSAYDGMNLGTTELNATLNFIDSHLPTNKASRVAGSRVIVSEYGWGGTLSSTAQEPPTRAFMQRTLSWGARFVLFWQIYDNEGLSYWLIDNAKTKTPCYLLHERFINQARLWTARFKESRGRLPDGSEFSAMMSPFLDHPPTSPTNLIVTHLSLSSLNTTSAVVRARVEQGVYGSEQATVEVFWGLVDGGTNSGVWQHSAILGLDTNFNPIPFSASLQGLQPGTNYYYRFVATNTGGVQWAPGSGRFNTDVFSAGRYGSLMKISLAGYNRNELLRDFPVLVRFTTNQVGFSYRQFASPTGGDLRFTDSTGAQLIFHEIDEWNTNGISHVWVRLPILSDTNDCIWAYWGNPLETDSPAYATNGSAWSDPFELVWHLKQTSFPFLDSTRNHPATTGSAPAGIPAGMVGRAVSFNGTSSHLNAGPVNLGDEVTLSSWVRVDPNANNIQTIWANKTGGSTTPGVALFVNSYQSQDAKLILESGNGSAAAYAATDRDAVPFGQWRHIAAVVNRAQGNAQLYVDGVDQSVTGEVRPDFTTNEPLMLGRFADGLYYFRGWMDETRIESVARSANWIWASWMVVASNATLVGYSPVAEQVPMLSTTVEPTSFSLHWPAFCVGYRLFSATNFATPQIWELVTNQPSLVGDRWQVGLSLPATAQRFFRLRSL